MNLYSTSKDYREQLSEEKCKKNGIYYTPESIVKLMVKEVLQEKKEYDDIKILDIASGCGVFYSEVLNYLIEKNREKKPLLDVKDYISDNLYSVEKDIGSVEVLKGYLQKNYNLKKGYKNNIVTDDALFPRNKVLKKGMFDIIIGNPPYVGHKSIDIEYSSKLRKYYPEVYANKSDIYYCFFKVAIDYLKEGGVASLIVPRYFLESQSALLVRKFIENNVTIVDIVDFRNSNVFLNGVGVSPCIITFKKNRSKESEELYKKRDNQSRDSKKTVASLNLPNIRIIKDKKDLERLLEGKFIIGNGYMDIDKTSWSLITHREKMIMDAIRKKKSYRLGDIVNNYQGIITGCDKAFILDNDSEMLEDIDKKTKKRWIKSKDINPYFIGNSNKVLIYTDDMEYKDIPKRYKAQLKNYEKKLSSRREVLRGIRKWYKLQWGREAKTFEQEKIIYPFKSKTNRFALDLGESFFSADVYFFTIKDEFKEKISYIYLLSILNSRVYQIYMQSFLKKMGNSIYEYYPYRLLETYILLDESYEEIESLGKRILLEENEGNVQNLMNKIDLILEKSLNVTDFAKK
ncbi:MAG: N-6 DNA methylase [Peptostreptococcus sp.]|uniref:Eco57I restriction-modification methylase domain-containing protein n=1 Tax=Peptostreptococcus sp. TaxID=1262 RepID=UPI002FC67578